MLPVNPVILNIRTSHKKSKAAEQSNFKEGSDEKEDMACQSLFDKRFHALLEKFETKKPAKQLSLNQGNIEVLNDNKNTHKPYGKKCSECQNIYRKNSMRGKSIVPFSLSNTKIDIYS